MNEIITVIDVETTGLDHTADHITEIAAIRAEVSADGSGGFKIREIGRFQTYVALPDGVVIPPEITELTRISADDLHGAPTLERALTALWYFARHSYIIAHNAPFDLAFVIRIFSTIGYSGEFVCTRALSRLVDPEESARLADVCARYGVPLNGHHRAMNDVDATLHVYAILREKAEINGITYRNVVIDSEERPLKYVPPGAIVRTIKRTEGAA
ncbi:3'-5' exonuclease [Paenibacillus sp. FSL L8-0436]|uniref:3'-5' exonuclease n=1 Tax=Paenibacillus sp. FSL L8-0436 TaxID=2954686 RepID=UPI003157F892